MTSRDHDFIADRYVNIKDKNAEFGEILFYERPNIFDGTTPTECLICIEAENEMYTKYAHPKAHLEAHKEADIIAEKMAINEKVTKEYIDYYTFHYGREYRRIYKELYKKYKQEYSITVLEKTYEKNVKMCDHHIECIQYHYALRNVH